MTTISKSLLPNQWILSYALLLSSVICPSVLANSPDDLLKGYEEQCKHENSSFQGFDASRGQMLYTTRQADSEWSCSTCHSDNPTTMGEHCVTHKQIQPISPIKNSDRFTDAAKVEKWFKRSCKDVLGRECTPQEKGDFIIYLLSTK